jgi:hypothetical protein
MAGWSSEAFSSEVGTGSREENASNEILEPVGSSRENYKILVADPIALPPLCAFSTPAAAARMAHRFPASDFYRKRR